MTVHYVRNCNIIVAVAVLLIPLSTIQHFMWPLSWCLIADICNHTWIPECAHDEVINDTRSFNDECDMAEYNCDFETDYEPINYSTCVLTSCAPSTCPMCEVVAPLRRAGVTVKELFIKDILPPNAQYPGKPRKKIPPSKYYRTRRPAPTSRYTIILRPKGYRRARQNVTLSLRRFLEQPTTPTFTKTTPPTKRKRKKKSKRNRNHKHKSPINLSNSTLQVTGIYHNDTVVLKRETIVRFGKTVVKIVKGIRPAGNTVTNTDMNVATSPSASIHITHTYMNTDINDVTNTDTNTDKYIVMNTDIEIDTESTSVKPAFRRKMILF